MGGYVDVAIPVYRPDARFIDVIKMLASQDVRPRKIIIMNTLDENASAFPDLSLYFENIEIHDIGKQDFYHGRTRNEAASYSDAPYLVFMTMDALPADEKLISSLLRPMSDEDTAVSYARQLPSEGCSVLERINRAYNYPDTERKKGLKDLDSLGVKTFFCSNACACYKREIFDRLGGFVDETQFNEDMIYASKAVRAGYFIYYTPAARVYHSHDYTLLEQYRRNVALGRSQAEHPEVFEDISSESEGMKFVKTGMKMLAAEGKLLLLPKFILFCAARYLGFRKGKRLSRLNKRSC